MKIRLMISAGLLALSAGFVTLVPAQATPFWTPSYFNCGVGKNAVLRFTVINNTVIVGYGRTALEASETPNYRFLTPGTRTITTGLTYGYWQKWADGGKGTITSHSYTCVNYLREPIAP